MTEQGHPAAERQLARIRARPGVDWETLLNEEIFSRDEWATIVTNRAFELFDPATAREEPERRSRRRYLGYYPGNRSKVTVPRETAYLNFWRTAANKFPMRTYDSYQHLDSLLIDDALTSAYQYNYIGKTEHLQSLPRGTRRDSLTSLWDHPEQYEVFPYGIHYTHKTVIPSMTGHLLDERITHNVDNEEGVNPYLESEILWTLHQRRFEEPAPSIISIEREFEQRHEQQLEEDYESPWLRE